MCACMRSGLIGPSFLATWLLVIIYYFFLTLVVRKACSHERAVEYMTATVGSKCVFKAHPCPSMHAAKMVGIVPCFLRIQAMQETLTSKKLDVTTVQGT